LVFGFGFKKVIFEFFEKRLGCFYLTSKSKSEKQQQ
jgi:hypothetical protein